MSRGRSSAFVGDAVSESSPVYAVEIAPAPPAGGPVGWLCRSWTQLWVLSLIYFCSIGAWNALNAMGGLGTGDTRLGHVCNTVLYGCGIAGGFLAGSAVNVFGLKFSVFSGATAQSIVLASVYITHYGFVKPSTASPTQTTLDLMWLFTLCSVIGGLFISWLLAGVASGLVRYPTESERSLYLAVGSAMLNLGGLAGSALSFGMNFDATGGGEGTGLNTLTYMLIVCFCACSMLLSLALQPPSRVRRSDGSTPELKVLSLRDEWAGVRAGLRERALWLMVPLFMSSLWHEVVIFNFFNTGLFNVRSRALNGGVYYIGRIAASFGFSALCEVHKARKRRFLDAIIGTAVLSGLGVAVCAIILANNFNLLTDTPVDFTEPRSITPVLAFLIYGSLETVATSFSFWLIGILHFKNASQAPRYVGWYRAFSSLGGCLPWGLDSSGNIGHVTQYTLVAVLWLIACVCLLVLRQLMDPDDESDNDVCCGKPETLACSNMEPRTTIPEEWESDQ